MGNAFASDDTKGLLGRVSCLRLLPEPILPLVVVAIERRHKNAPGVRDTPEAILRHFSAAGKSCSGPRNRYFNPSTPVFVLSSLMTQQNLRNSIPLSSDRPLGILPTRTSTQPRQQRLAED